MTTTITKFLKDSSDIGSLFCDLLNNQIIQGTKTFKSIPLYNDGTTNYDLAIKNDLTPTGSIIAYLGTSDPASWVICDGLARVNNSKFDKLIGLNIGTVTNGYYYPPDLRGKFLYGKTDAVELKTTGGASSVTLVTANLPSHSHGMDHWHGIPSYYSWSQYLNDSITTRSSGYGWGPSTSDNGDQRLAYPKVQENNAKGIETSNARVLSTGGAKTDTGNTGSDTAFNILPPYYNINYIMKL